MDIILRLPIPDVVYGCYVVIDDSCGRVETKRVDYYVVHEKQTSTHSFRWELNITALSKVNMVLGAVARDVSVTMWFPAVKLSRE